MGMEVLACGTQQYFSTAKSNEKKLNQIEQFSHERFIQ